MSFFEKHKKGIIGTAVFHICVLLMLIFLGFFTPLPLPGEEGILVNFGTSDHGLGDIEPGSVRSEPEPARPVQQIEAPVPPPPPAAPPASRPNQAKETAMTQDFEKTAAIEAAEQKKREADRQKQIEAEKRKQQEQQQAELERQQRQAELERQQRAEAERKKAEEEQKKISEIDSRAKGAFGGTGQGTAEGRGSGDNPNQGVTFPGGNQGVPTGDPNAGTYGPGGSGSGNQGTGVSYSLSGRTAKALPKPAYPGNDEGVVVVKVTVDKYGNVTAAEPGVRGTTIMDQRFWNEARQAALKSKFNLDENAPAFQQGTISYRFKLS